MVRRRLSPRARALWAVGAGAAVVGVVVLGLVFQPWLLFVDVRVDDDIPAASAPAAPPVVRDAPPSASATMVPVEEVAPGPVDLSSGAFISHEHPTTGTVRVIELPGGMRQLAIESLETTNGPDVHVWLSAAPVVEGTDGWFTAAGYPHVDLGPIKGNLGDQLYDIPADLDLAGFPTVELWCEQFSVSFGAAALN